jgi:hypothetical protein
VTAESGVSETQARAIWHAIAEARAGRFDALAVHAELVAAGYMPLEADTLVEEVLERLVGRQSADTETAKLDASAGMPLASMSLIRSRLGRRA